MGFDRDAKKILTAQGKRVTGFNLQQAGECKQRLTELAQTVVSAQAQVEAAELEGPGSAAMDDEKIAALVTAYADTAIEAAKAIVSFGLEPSAIMSLRQRALLGQPSPVRMVDYVRAKRLFNAHQTG